MNQMYNSGKIKLELVACIIVNKAEKKILKFYYGKKIFVSKTYKKQTTIVVIKIALQMLVATLYFFSAQIKLLKLI